MESTVKSTFGAPARQLLCCISADFTKEKDFSIPRCPSKGRAQQLPRKQKSKRDSAFVQQKAERAAMRAHLREKYQLPKNRTDKKQLEAAGGKMKLPQDLLAIVKPTGPSASGSIFTNFGKLDFRSLRMTAENAVQALQRPVQCPNRTDKKQLEAAGGKMKLPQDLLAIVKPTGPSASGSIFTNFGKLDFRSLRMTAENAVQALQRPVQCPVM